MATGCDQFNQTRLRLSLFSGGLKKNIRCFKEVRLRGDPFWETLHGPDPFPSHSFTIVALIDVLATKVLN